MGIANSPLTPSELQIRKNGGHQHSVVQLLKHDVRRSYIIVYQCTGMDKRQTAQYAKCDLHRIFEVETAFVPDGVVERHATVELRHEVMVDHVAFAHLAVIDITDDVLVLVRIQLLTKLDFIDFLALEELLARNATEVVDLHEIHHIVRAEHRI